MGVVIFFAVFARPIPAEGLPNHVKLRNYGKYWPRDQHAKRGWLGFTAPAGASAGRLALGAKVAIFVEHLLVEAVVLVVIIFRLWRKDTVAIGDILFAPHRHNHDQNLVKLLKEPRF